MDAVTDDRVPGLTGWRPEGCERIALMLQGGGALGAYQAGVYQALDEAGVQPDWVSGVSIGAINAALIAGNRPEDRLDRLHAFWNRITDRRIWLFTPEGDEFRRMRNAQSAHATMTLGQPGFFKPNRPSPWASQRGASTATAIYDTSPLRETLLELVDWRYLNQGRMRFAVGAVNVLSGNFAYFDNTLTEIGPEHVMASGALPPALPMIRVGTDYYWDGGLVSNTPLQHLLDAPDQRSTLVFQVDLFSARGPLPRDMEDVLGRHKDIQYSSRTRAITDYHHRLHELRLKLKQAYARLPEDQLSDAERALKAELEHLPSVNILQMIYQQKAYEGHAKDYEFSRTSMREHWGSGYEDTRRTLKRRDWMAMPAGGAIIAHDVHRLGAD